VHLEKAYMPIDVTVEGIVIEVKLLQSEKVPDRIDFTFVGMLIEIKLIQPEKALASIETIELGIITTDNPFLVLKADSGIVFGG
jgi:hypothetical protein